MNNNIIELAESNILHTYNRYQIVFDRGEGVYLYDDKGKKYLDFAAGIAVMALGYNNKEYTDALKNQAEKLLHTSNLFYTAPAAQAGEKFIKASGMDRVFFTNSGAEAIEGALKSARKYAYNKNHNHEAQIIAMKNSFHGRTFGALSVTGNEHYQEPFKPLIGGIKFAEYNNLESVKELVNENTCAIILETVQGEGGLTPATEEFLKGIRKICDDNDILLILDEIQCGMGRTGYMFAWQEYGIKPDIMTSAKALGCGVPVGCFATTDKAATLVAGDHGTTYGGNPFACAAVSKVFDLYKEENILENVRKTSIYLEEKLDELVKKYDFIIQRRGKGLMQGLQLSIAPSKLINKALDNGLVIISAGTDMIRMVPPLIINCRHVDEMIQKLEKSISEL